MIQSERDHSTPTNPFRPGMGLDPPYLADRTAQLARFDQYLAGFPSFPRNVRLTGLRGVGKTVLLQHYASAAEDWGWVVVRRECSEHLQDESTFALALVEDCRRAVEHSSRTGALRRRSGTAARRVLDLLGSLTISLEGVTIAVKPPTVAASQPALLEDRLYQALELACEGATEARRPGVLLSYDEAHVLSDTPRPAPVCARTLPRQCGPGSAERAAGDVRRLRAANTNRQPRPRQELLGANVPGQAPRHAAAARGCAGLHPAAGGRGAGGRRCHRCSATTSDATRRAADVGHRLRLALRLLSRRRSLWPYTQLLPARSM